MSSKNIETQPIPRVVEPIIQNVVSISRLVMDQNIDLTILAAKMQGVRYNSKRFPAAVIRKSDPKCTGIIFSTGKLIVIGSSNQFIAEQSVWRIICDVSKVMNIKIKIGSFNITNFVASAELGVKVNFQQLLEEKGISKNSGFPGIVYRKLPNVKSALIFASGKVVFTGATSKKDIDQAFKILKDKFSQNKDIVLDELVKKQEIQIQNQKNNLALNQFLKQCKQIKQKGQTVEKDIQQQNTAESDQYS